MTTASDLLPGSYVVVNTGTLFGWFIKRFCGGSYDHAFIWNGDGTITEATVKGVKVDSPAQYAGHLAAANTGETLTDAQRAAIVAKARSFAGLEYGWGDIAVIALRLLGFRWGWLQRVADDRDALICSELVCKAGLAAGLASWQCMEPDPAFVTPADLSRRPGVVPVSL